MYVEFPRLENIGCCLVNGLYYFTAMILFKRKTNFICVTINLFRDFFTGFISQYRFYRLQYD